MDETLHQLETLLLGSIPTIFLFLLLVILYRLLVYGPLTRVLDERRERTEGAIEQANAASAAAAAKTQEYEAQLRAARSRIFQARQQKQQLWNRERDNAIAEAHAAAQRQVEEAKLALQGPLELDDIDVRQEPLDVGGEGADIVERNTKPGEAQLVASRGQFVG